MAELAVETTTEAVEPQVEEKSRFKTFNVNHPRTAKVVGIAAVTALTLGAVQAWKARKQDDTSSEEPDTDVTVSFDESSETI